MKEKPILFSTPMVRALLAGTKTQTRRIAKPQPTVGACKSKYEVGDVLWVRETWQAWWEYDKIAPRDIPNNSDINYPSDGNVWKTRVRSPLFMPRWASRIRLEVTDVRIERLQAINADEAIAEGIDTETLGSCREAVEAYAQLWESINGPGSWAENPWVWVVSFQLLAPKPI